MNIGRAAVARRVFLVIAVAIKLAAPAQAAEPAIAMDHHAVSTEIPGAQQAFDEGMMLRYAFNDPAAVAAFERAAQLDPHLAMAYWGIALSNGVDINTPPSDPREAAAAKAIGQAQALLQYASPAERDYIQALALRCSEYPKADRAALGAKYHDAMRALAARYPEDPDAGTLFAESALDVQWAYRDPAMDGMLMPNEDEIKDPEIVPALRLVLLRSPAHLGANHLLIHALDFRKTAAQALPSADLLAAQSYAPAASHLAHMASHIYFRVGRYAAAVKANQAALALDQRYFATTPETDNPAAYRYHRHNASYLAFAAMTIGDWQSAQSAAKELPTTSMPLIVLARFERWPAILAAAPPHATKPAGQPTLDQTYHMARGLAFAAQHRLAAAEAERAELVRLVAAIPAAETETAAVGALRVAYLDSQLEVSQGRYDSAVATLQAAIPIEDSITHGELLPFFLPLREALGRTLLAAGDPAEAATAFRDDLSRTLNNPRSQAGLAKALAAQLSRI